MYSDIVSLITPPFFNIFVLRCFVLRKSVSTASVSLYAQRRQNEKIMPLRYMTRTCW